MHRRDANQLSKFAKKERAVTAALADDLRAYAVKRWPTMNHEWRKAKLASLLNMRLRRVRSFWDAEETLSPRQFEVDAINSLIGAEEEIARVEADRALAERVAELEAQLAVVMAALAGDQVEASGGATWGQGEAGNRTDRSAPRRGSGNRD